MIQDKRMVPICECPECHAPTAPDAITVGGDGVLVQAIYQCRQDFNDGAKCRRAFRYTDKRTNLVRMDYKDVSVRVRHGIFRRGYRFTGVTGFKMDGK